MKIHGVYILVAFIIGSLLGILVGFNLRSAQNEEKPINLSPFPQTCHYNGTIYKSGDGFPSTDGCNTCGCENGQVACTLMACEE
jgi:hypothetical protein